ncbi:hypothetical protein H0I29_07745 [Polaribacter sp. R2A056_3_33]|jgi:hypothetical protein|uniref:hypothetical protein n=1 Tax=Polaribacter sp. R2A056_3_33 TaxID=2745563 RepID=UPI001C4F5AAE|nr:hypothetical protein [Polaribacter sp. R2A056_3_33]QXP71947.1 hypothetical protein H0I29_07745 [Polaribacter sp. R2A056_3_33]
MKKTLITLLLLIQVVNLSSQNSKIEYENFKLQENKKLVWQKIYDNKVSKDSIFTILSGFISQNSFLNNLKYKDFTFSGYSNFLSISNTKGLSLAVQKEFNCFVKIEIKPNKYRVTISNVKFKPVSMDFGGITFDDPMELESLAVRNNHFELRKNKKSKETLQRLNSDFINLLELKNTKKDNW